MKEWRKTGRQGRKVDVHCFFFFFADLEIWNVPMMTVVAVFRFYTSGWVGVRRTTLTLTVTVTATATTAAAIAAFTVDVLSSLYNSNRQLLSYRNRCRLSGLFVCLFVCLFDCLFVCLLTVLKDFICNRQFNKVVGWFGRFLRDTNSLEVTVVWVVVILFYYLFLYSISHSVNRSFTSIRSLNYSFFFFFFFFLLV